MEERRSKKPRRLNPMRIADQANRRFVKLAQSLMRLITWRRCIRPADANDSNGETGSRSPPCAPAADPRFFASLARRVERILSRVHPAKEEPDHEVLQLQLRELFHEDMGCRLAAASWIRKRGPREALPTLESVLSIEESSKVRDEIKRAVLKIKACGQNDSGGVRCSSF